MIKVIARVHPVHLMHADWAPGGRQPSEQANRLGLSPLSAIAIVPVPKAVYRCGYRDKHNHPRCDSNLGPLTSQSDALNTRPLRPAVRIKQTRPTELEQSQPVQPYTARESFSICLISLTAVFHSHPDFGCGTPIRKTRSSAIAEGTWDASCQLKPCQLPHNSAETTYTTSPDQIDGMKLEI